MLHILSYIKNPAFLSREAQGTSDLTPVSVVIPKNDEVAVLFAYYRNESQYPRLNFPKRHRKARQMPTFVELSAIKSANSAYITNQRTRFVGTQPLNEVLSLHIATGKWIPESSGG